ncbi:MAG: glycosyltransferase family 4 protein [Thermodesulfobacteriota bacterium]
MKIACFTPLPPVKSGISQYSEELLPYLSLRLDVDIFIDDYEPKEGLREMLGIYSYKEFEERHEKAPYDLCIYQMGNNPYHFYMYPFLLKYPGITVMHDYVLHHFYSGYYLAKGDKDGYIREMEYNYGARGREMAERRIAGIWTELQNFIFPANKRIIDSSVGIIVHNDYSKKMIERSHRDAVVKKIFMGMPAINKPLFSKAEVKKKLGIPYDSFVVGSFGFVTPIKRLDRVVHAFREFIKEVPCALLLIVGDVSEHNQGFIELIDQLGLKKYVRITGFVPEEEFNDYILATDVAVNLRYPTAGETSASLLRVMGMGVPVMVSNYRQFAEISDYSCIKISLGKNEVGDLRGALVRLASSKTLRKSLGENARKYVAENCSLEGAAAAYSDFIEDIVRRKVQWETVSTLKEEFSAIGITDDNSPACERLKEAVKELAGDDA